MCRSQFCAPLNAQILFWTLLTFLFSLSTKSAVGMQHWLRCWSTDCSEGSSTLHTSWGNSASAASGTSPATDPNRSVRKCKCFFVASQPPWWGGGGTQWSVRVRLLGLQVQLDSTEPSFMAVASILAFVVRFSTALLTPTVEWNDISWSSVWLQMFCCCQGSARVEFLWGALHTKHSYSCECVVFAFSNPLCKR